MNGSRLLTSNFPTDRRIDYVSMQNEETISLIRILNLNKASGSHWLSGQMLLLCVNSTPVPLNISTYPGISKLAKM